MKKFFKILAWLMGSIVVLLVAAAVVVPMVFDINDYRSQISALVKKQTGRELTIEGKMKLSVFPWLGVDIGKMELSNAPGFGPAPFARIGGAEVKVKLLPLLHKKVETDKIVLSGLVLNLGRRADGTTNWSDLVKAPAAAAPAPGKGAPAAKGGAGNALGALAIGGLELRDASVTWDDRMSGARYAISHLNLVSGAVRPDRPFDVTLAFDADSTKPAVSGHVKFASHVTLDLTNQRFRLDTTDLAADLHGALLAGGRAALTLHSNIALDLPAQRYRLDGTALTANLEGKLAPGGKIAATLHGDIAADLKAQTLQVAALKLSTLGVDLQGDVRGTRIMDAPSFSGRLQSAAFVPQDVAKQLGVKLPPMADPSALTKAAFSFGFDAGLDHAALSNLVLQLDDTKLTGSASVRDFKRPVIRYALDADQMDVDRYLPPPAPKPARRAATPATAAAAAAVQLPLPLLRSLDIQGTVKVGKLKVMNLRSTALHATLSAKDGVFHLHPVGAQLYKGSYQGNLMLDVRGRTPISGMDEKLSGVQVGPLLKDFMGKEYVSGTANVSAKMTAHGLDPLAVRKSLNGQAAFSFTNGTVNGVNIGLLLRKAYAAYKKLPPPPDEAKKTDFAALSGTVKVVNGVVSNNDLSAKSPLLRIDGKGSANLVTETINYRVEAGVTGSMEGQGGKELSQLQGTPIPILITGTFSAPKFNVDLQAILDARLKQAVEQERKKQEQRLRKNLENELQNKLKGMLKF